MAAFGRNVVHTASFFQAPAAGTPTAEEKKTLQAIRQALADRDILEADKLVAEAKKTKGSAAFTEQFERLELLSTYVSDFWKAVDRGVRKYQSMEEVVVGESRAAFVEFENGVLVLKVAGENKRYDLKTVKAKMSVTFALKALDEKAPSTKVIVGAFWAMDGMGDRKVAKGLWDDAAKAGQAQAVKDISGELAIAAVKSVDVPNLPPQYRQMLEPKNWQIRAVDSKAKVVRAELGAMGMQNQEGRLEFKLDQSESPAQLVFKRKLAGNFTAKLILQDVEEGQTFGLYSADAKDGGFTAALPSGTVKVELVRAGQTLTCKVNDEEAKLETVAGAQPRMPGQIGVGLPPKGGVVVAAFEVK